MNYRFKRNLAKLGPYFVSKEIGISYDKYKEVENRERSLNEEQLNKFSLLTGVNKKNAQLSFDISTGNALNWLKENDLPKLAKEFNMSIDDIAIETGISKGTLYDLKSGRSTNKDKVLMLYDFFNDKSNKRNKIKKQKEEIKNERITRQKIENVSMYDFKGIIEKLNFKAQHQLEGALGLSVGNITWWKKGRPIRQTYLDKINELLTEVGSSLAEYTLNDGVEVVELTEELLNEDISNEIDSEVEIAEEIETPATGLKNDLKTSTIESEVKNGEGKYNIEDETVTITIEDYIAIKTSLSKSEGKIIELKREIQFLRNTIESLNTLIKK